MEVEVAQVMEEQDLEVVMEHQDPPVEQVHSILHSQVSQEIINFITSNNGY